MTHKKQMKIRRVLATVLLIIGAVALMAEPIDNTVEDYATKVFLSKAVFMTCSILAVVLVESKREEREFIESLE